MSKMRTQDSAMKRIYVIVDHGSFQQVCNNVRTSAKTEWDELLNCRKKWRQKTKSEIDEAFKIFQKGKM